MWRQTSVKIWIYNDKYVTYLIIYDKSGDRKAFVATIVANVATERIWLDTTELKNKLPTKNLVVELFLSLLKRNREERDLHNSREEREFRHLKRFVMNKTDKFDRQI